MDVFKFLKGRSIQGLDAQIVGEELDKIRQSNGGRLTPEDVLNAASDPASPLHTAFEWDDTLAARQWRLTQARRVIVSVTVINSPVSQASRVAAYVSVKTPEHGRTYVPTVEALDDEALKERVMDQVRVFIETLQRRYSAYQNIQVALTALKEQVG